MKNLISTILKTVLVFIAFFSCSDDIEPVADSSSQTPNPVVSGLIEDLYSNMYIIGTGGSTNNGLNAARHDDFGHKIYDIHSDVLSGEMAVISSFGWYADISNYTTTTDFTKIENEMCWTYYYHIIDLANNIIDVLGGNNADPSNNDDRHSLGQAFAMRAHSYFYLTQYFANDYDPNAAIFPLYIVPNSGYQAKVLTSVIYSQMEWDLNRAITLLDNYNRPEKKHVNKEVAKAILAYVIASTKDVNRLQEVINLCDDVINNSGASIMNSNEVVGGFNDANTSGWIWGINFSLQTVSYEEVANWWSFIDAYTYGYAWSGDHKVIDENLYNLISPNDIRKTQFFNVINSTRYLQPLSKFYDSNQVFGGGSQNTSNPSNQESDYIFMRITEFYLLKAESQAKLGLDADARNTLAQILTQRLPDISYLNALSGTLLQDEIYFQTRIELWGEGKVYLALKRNEQMTIPRGNNHSSFIGQSFAHNDERLTFEIPASEIANNPFINSQN